MITDEQRRKRVNSIGSSEVAALFGLHPSMTGMDLYLEKTERLDPDRTSSAAEMGNWLEPALLNWAESGPPALGKLERNVELRGLAGDPLRIHANLDARIVKTGETVEAKVSGLEGPVFGEWGDDGTNDVPSHVGMQVHHQLLCTGVARGHVVALLGGRGFCYFVIERDEEIAGLIRDATSRFWHQHVQPRVPPHCDGDLATLAVLKRIVRQHRVVKIQPQLYAAWREARDTRIEFEKMEECLKREIISALGIADCGDAGAQGGVSYIRQKKTTVDAHKLKMDYRVAWNACKRTTESPTLRVTKPIEREKY